MFAFITRQSASLGANGPYPPESCLAPRRPLSSGLCPSSSTLTGPISFSWCRHHCEQSGNQSLFTNQLSSAPRQRRSSRGIRKGPVSIFPRLSASSACREELRGASVPELRRAQLWLWEQQSGSWLRGNPSNVICNLSHNQHARNPSNQSTQGQRCRHIMHQLPQTQGDDTTSRPATLPSGFSFRLVRLPLHLRVSFLKIKGPTGGHTKASTGLGDEMKNAPTGGSGAAMLSLPAHHPLGHRF